MNRINANGFSMLILLGNPSHFKTRIGAELKWAGGAPPSKGDTPKRMSGAVS